MTDERLSISFDEAVRIARTFTDATLKEPIWQEKFTLQSTNDSVYGYQIPLGSPETKFFKLKDENIIVVVSEGREYEFDGLLWTDVSEPWQDA
jgi:hypothetical protein